MTYQPIEAIPSTAPQPNLLTSTRRVPGEWKSGVSFRDTGIRTRGAWPYAAGAGHDDKVLFEAVGPQLPAFLPVMLYVPLECDSVTARAEAELLAELADEIEAVSAMQLARIMAGSVSAGPTLAEWAVDPACGLAQNPTLSQPYPGHTFAEAGDDTSTQNVVVGTAGDHPVAAFSTLLAEYTARTLKGGATIHVPVRLLPHLTGNGVVRRQGDVYVGDMDSVVIPHAELVGPAAGDDGVPDPAGAGNAWMYATGPVEASVGDARVLPEAGQRWRHMGRLNQWSVVVERLAIYRFNPSVVLAAEAAAPTAGL